MFFSHNNNSFLAKEIGCNSISTLLNAMLDTIASNPCTRMWLCFLDSLFTWSRLAASAAVVKMQYCVVMQCHLSRLCLNKSHHLSTVLACTLPQYALIYLGLSLYQVTFLKTMMYFVFTWVSQCMHLKVFIHIILDSLSTNSHIVINTSWNAVKYLNITFLYQPVCAQVEESLPLRDTQGNM